MGLLNETVNESSMLPRTSNRAAQSGIATGPEEMVMAAQAAHQNGNPEQAAALYEMAVDHLSTTAARYGALLGLAGAYCDAGRLDLAEGACRLAVDEYPVLHAGHAMLASVLLDLGRVGEAAEAATEALIRAPGNVTLLNLATGIALRRGRAEEARMPGGNGPGLRAEQPARAGPLGGCPGATRARTGGRGSAGLQPSAQGDDDRGAARIRIGRGIQRGPDRRPDDAIRPQLSPYRADHGRRRTPGRYFRAGAQAFIGPASGLRRCGPGLCDDPRGRCRSSRGCRPAGILRDPELVEHHGKRRVRATAHPRRRLAERRLLSRSIDRADGRYVRRRRRDRIRRP